MIKINCIGVIKDKSLNNLVNDYVEKIKHYHKIEVIAYDLNFKGEINKIIELESEYQLKHINDSDYVILLDLHGKSIDSVTLSKVINEKLSGNICFVIAGSYGLSDKLRKRANLSIKLSDLTFLHTHTRLILLEQIYRSFKIINNQTYHK